MGNEHCRWVQDRLPLLVGGDLGVADRRGVERHLIGCPGCRGRQRSLDGALAALKAAASDPLARPGSPSVWPDLALQIRQSRHAPPRVSWADRLAHPFRSGLGPGPAVGLAFGVVGLIIGLLGPAHRNTWSPAFDAPSQGRPPLRLEVAGPPAPRPRPIGPDRPAVLVTKDATKPDADRFAAPPSLRVMYDLEYGTPMGPGNRDPQRSY